MKICSGCYYCNVMPNVKLHSDSRMMQKVHSHLKLFKEEVFLLHRLDRHCVSLLVLSVLSKSLQGVHHDSDRQDSSKKPDQFQFLRKILHCHLVLIKFMC